MPNPILFPTLGALTSTAEGVVGLGTVYIGTVDTDPTVLGNRISVTVRQEDGSEVVIAAASQPLTLSAGGVFIYNGSPVMVLVDSSYSMTILDADGAQAYYFPQIDPISSTDVSLSSQGGDPATDGAGHIYTKTVGGVVELFYMDGDGNVIQLTSGGALLLPEVLPLPVQGSDPATLASNMKLYSKVINGNLELFALDPNGNAIQITNDGNLAAGEGASVAVSGTTYTITGANNGQLLIFNETDNITITVPEQNTENLTAGFYFLVKNQGTGEILMAVEGTDTFDGVKLLQRPDLATTIFLQTAASPNTWAFVGNDWVPTTVKSSSLTAPPATPGVGAVYVVAATATGSWAGQEDNFAIHVGSDVYEFQSPENAILAYDEAAGSWIGWTGSAWIGASFGTDYPSITNEAGTTLTVTNAMAGNLIVFNNASDCTLTLPETATETLAVGFEVSVINLGAGDLFIAFEGSDTHTGVRMVQDRFKPTTIKKMTAGSPNDWLIYNNTWLIDTMADWTTTAPPATPANGTIYYVDGAGSGAWAAANRDFVVHVGSGVYDVQEPVMRYQDFYNQVNTKRETLDTTNGTVYASN